MHAQIMTSTPSWQHVAHETDRTEANRAELVERIARAVRTDGGIEPLPGLRLYRASAPTGLAHGVSEPAFCVVAQGSKEVFLGDERYQYDPMHYLLVTAELPIVGHVIEASRERPYLSLSLKLDPTLVSAVMIEAGHFVPRGSAHVRAIDVSDLNASLLEAVVRLIRLVDTPAEASFLMPLIVREIIYRLLRGEQGERLRHMASQDGHTQRIVKAIGWLRKEFDKPLRIEEIARNLGMSVSSFHHHFKAVTAMSPLQYQKQIRLQEARRLMLAEGLDAADAGFRVGYHDAAHFSREYKRLFGEPPMRNVRRLMEELPTERPTV
ncbi:MAG: AraC family transcriptional regulator [Anaerolineae bacterium]|nr:AraC family transcriptional regulator [Anaerolineae bacterium]